MCWWFPCLSVLGNRMRRRKFRIYLYQKSRWVVCVFICVNEVIIQGTYKNCNFQRYWNLFVYQKNHSGVRHCSRNCVECKDMKATAVTFSDYDLPRERNTCWFWYCLRPIIHKPVEFQSKYQTVITHVRGPWKCKTWIQRIVYLWLAMQEGYECGFPFICNLYLKKNNNKKHTTLFTLRTLSFKCGIFFTWKDVRDFFNLTLFNRWENGMW